MEEGEILFEPHEFFAMDLLISGAHQNNTSNINLSLRYSRNAMKFLDHNQRKTISPIIASPPTNRIVRSIPILPNTPYSKPRPLSRVRVPKRCNPNNLMMPSNDPNKKKEARLSSLLLLPPSTGRRLLHRHRTRMQ